MIKYILEKTIIGKAGVVIVLIMACYSSNQAQTIDISFPDTTAFEAETIWLPLRVNDFERIVSIEFTLVWDESILRFVDEMDADLGGVAVGDTRADEGLLRFSWFAVSDDFVTLPDNSVISLLQFEVLGSIGDQTDLSIIDLPFQPVEIAQADTSPDDVVLLSLSEEEGSVTIVERPQISASINVDDIDCKGDQNGSITLTVESANTQVFFNWQGAEGFTSREEDLNNLSPGIYFLEITDEEGRTLLQDTLTVQEPENTLMVEDVEVRNVDCATTTGSATILVNGGTPPYQFNVGDQIFDNPQIEGLAPGNYEVRVTDANNCETTENFTIQEQPDLVVDDIIVNTTNCTTGTGSALVEMSSGTAPYTYDVGSGSVDQNLLNNLSPGDYTVTVTDANRCSGEAAFTILPPVALVIDTIEVLPTDCTTGFGSVVIRMETGTPPFNFQVGDRSSNENEINNLEPDEYDLLITDANGCTAEAGFTIDLPPGINVLLGEDIRACEGETVSISVGEFATYNWSNGSTDASILVSSPGRYSVTVSDDKGCTAQDAIFVSFDESLDLNVDQSDFLICPGETVELSAVGADSYQWIDTSNTLSDPTIPNPVATPAYFTGYAVVGENGCGKDTMILAIDVIQVNASAGPDTCVAAGVEVELNVSGGVSFFWEDAIYPVSNPLIPNPRVKPEETVDYVVQITDENGCTIKDTVQVLIAVDPSDITLVNLITPNGDGRNDELVFDNIVKFGQNSLRVYNRWGDVVFQKVNYMLDEERFDGTHNGAPLPAGNYYYVLSFRSVQFKQTLTIVRE